MSTLLLRLAAPLQSWGLDSKFERRLTMREPTKSGVIGMLAAALGRSRDDDVSDLARLRFGVRVDQPGQLLRDYHTARGEKTNVYVTERYYLADAVFLAGFEGDEDTTAMLDEALNNPVYPLFLGRRSCPPEGRLSLGVRASSLELALVNEEWLAGSWFKSKKPDGFKATIIIDADKPGAIRRRDIPVSYSQKRRVFEFRYLSVQTIDIKSDVKNNIDASATDHDAWFELGG